MGISFHGGEAPGVPATCRECDAEFAAQVRNHGRASRPEARKKFLGERKDADLPCAERGEYGPIPNRQGRGVYPRSVLRMREGNSELSGEELAGVKKKEDD